MSQNMAFNNMDYFYKNYLFNVSPLVYLLLVDLLVNVCKCATPSEINKHLELGKDFLAKGQLSDALNHYHAAVEGDPNNYLTYFKRGTVYLALGKAKNALSDLDKVLELKPDFTVARLSRGSVHLKQASFDLAQLDFYNVLNVDPYNSEANELIHRIEPAKSNYLTAKSYYELGDYYSAIQLLTAVLEISPWTPEIREMRADCHMKSGNSFAAVSDIRSTNRLQSDNTQGYFKLAQLLYDLGDATDSLKEIRECLKLDPEHKDCFPFYKKIKKVEKFLTESEQSLEQNDFTNCIESAEKVLKHEKEVTKIVFSAKKLLCTCYSKDEQSTLAVEACQEALELYSQDPSVYCDRAEAYIQTEMYDDAIRDYKSALELDESLSRAKEGMQRAQKLQHQAEKRDYYKILGVKRTASKKEIVKAYRKAAQKWHPDNFKGDEKKLAEKKFIDIAAAKEVLTNEEKRQQFDMGEDPLDPEQGRGGGGAHHFQHFQYGSPFQFKFHFN